MTRKQAHRLVKYKKLPRGAVASCPYCKAGYSTLLKPYNWGDVEKAKAQVVDHILAAHADREVAA